MYGDPHLVTLDGLQYTFNGRGEFVLVQTLDNLLTVQGRMIPVTNEGKESLGTVFSAVVAKGSTSDTVEFQYSLFGIRTLVNGKWIVVDTGMSAKYTSVVVRNRGNDTYSALFSTGAAVEVKGDSGFLSRVVVSLPDSFQHITAGLLGVFSGDIRDDLLPQNGSPLPRDVDAETLHYEFGLSCKL